MINVLELLSWNTLLHQSKIGKTYKLTTLIKCTLCQYLNNVVNYIDMIMHVHEFVEILRC